MRKSILIMLGVLSLFSCTQEENAFLVDENSRTEVQELTAAEAQSKFARILSKAVSGSVEVRRFSRRGGRQNGVPRPAGRGCRCKTRSGQVHCRPRRRRAQRH